MKTLINTIIRQLIWVLLVFPVQSYGEVTLPQLISDGMVLQRDTKVKIWGWANPGEKVTVKFRSKSYIAKTSDDGRWHVILDPVKAGGPYSMEIVAENNIKIEDILFGDVWVCSGQSNMTHYLGRHKERYAREISEANYPEIRQFLTPTISVLTGPKEDLPDIKWVSSTPESVLDFTVIGYFFAKMLYDKYHVPMGIINTCVGGSPIEAWISEEGFKDFPDILETIKKNKDTAYINKIDRERMANRMADGPKKEADKGLTGPVKWYENSYEPLNWKRICIPGYWEDQGVRDLDGVVWYRREIDVPGSMTGVEANIALGRIVDADELYINGKRIGNTTYQYPQRNYTIPPGVLKQGKNLLVVRVTNNSGRGGFVPDKPYYLTAAGQTIDLVGYWQYKVGEVYHRDRRGGGGSGLKPSCFYNGMIAPFVNYAIRGALWYQGESNTGNPQGYKKLLPALINDWREKWQLGDFTFLIAQLPNFMDVDYSPAKSNWAMMREAQLKIAQEMSNTGIGINIDLGEWNDIHPGNKKPVGERLALQAMRITYGEKDIICSGPVFKSYRIEGGKIILSFDHIGSGLTSGNGEELGHFAIAGEDGKFKWGNAIIDNNEVVVWNDKILNPEFIRYAWADNPDFANLYNKEGLPASPFRTDDFNE